MDWITGIERAIAYIEEHLLEPIDYEVVAAQSFSSSYHFQRVFSILFGFTLGEYIRNRRLSLAGAELATGKTKVIDVAFAYGYENPDSFAKAFQKFHGITPSQAREGGEVKSFSRLSLSLSLKGGQTMNYRIEQKPAMILTGYRAHFAGMPYGRERYEQEMRLAVTTRGKQYFLAGAANFEDVDSYCVIENIDDSGYDYIYCHNLDEWTREHLYDREVMGVDFVESLGLEFIHIPAQMYAIFETKDVKKPTEDYAVLLNERVKLLTEWMPDLGFQLSRAPEIAVYHWNPRKERRIEIWMPIEKK